MAARLLGLAFALAIFVPAAPGATPEARSAADVAAACQSAQPGDTIVLADGSYADEHIVLHGTGTPDRPITLRAQTPGRALLTGTSRLSIGGEHLVVDGLQFRDGALASGSVIEFRADGVPARHCTLRNTAIADYNPARIDTRYCWVSLHGTDNRVEHCSFSGQTHSGVTLCVWLDQGKPARHRVSGNYFGNRARGNANGFETIRIGTSRTSMTNARCLVEANLFERCDGEIEIISNKSCENTYRGNTFLRCSGCLTLRHGSRCTVERNTFLGGDAKGVGGVRVVGEGHRVTGNYFSGTKGRAGGAVSLQTGIPNSPPSGYFQVKDCRIDGNAFAGNPGPLFAFDAGYDGEKCSLLPQNVVVVGNQLIAAPGAKPMLAAARPTPGVSWQGNLAVGGRLGVPPITGIRHVEAIPADWQSRPLPRALERREVGPVWMRP